MKCFAPQFFPPAASSSGAPPKNKKYIFIIERIQYHLKYIISTTYHYLSNDCYLPARPQKLLPDEEIWVVRDWTCLNTAHSLSSRRALMFVGPVLFSGRWRAFAGGGAGRALARRNVFCYPPLSYTEIWIWCYIFWAMLM